jgi:hypothetical protein
MIRTEQIKTEGRFLVMIVSFVCLGIPEFVYRLLRILSWFY